MKFTNYDHPPACTPVPTATVRRGCHQVTPYQAGLEDTLYDREYRNPFQPGTAEWENYEAGNQDARRAVLS